ncbi:MAG: DMT family transporter [Bacteroidales bacterium]|nr:DMT family transporter [Bacteroidales bacterium]
MWTLLAVVSAMFLGLYDVAKKSSLKSNPVISVLAVSTGISAIFFIPFALNQIFGLGWFGGTMFDIAEAAPRDYLLVFFKTIIVYLSWILSYFGLKTTPLSIYGPLNASRPMLVLLGAIAIYGERLNVYQWIGIVLAIGSLFMLSISSRKNEGIDFRHNRGIWCVALGMVFGAASALYDKFLLVRMDNMFVQTWFVIFQAGMMLSTLALVKFFQMRKTARGGGDAPEKFHWSPSILAISVFLTLADFAYFYSLTLDGAMVSVVSTLRRASVVVSFLFAALVFKEKNIRSKAVDLGLVLLGMVFLLLGTR